LILPIFLNIIFFFPSSKSFRIFFSYYIFRESCCTNSNDEISHVRAKCAHLRWTAEHHIYLCMRYFCITVFQWYIIYWIKAAKIRIHSCHLATARGILAATNWKIRKFLIQLYHLALLSDYLAPFRTSCACGHTFWN